MTLDRVTRDPRAWDLGCARDAVRNDLVIPHLREMLRRADPCSVIDIGCGSGYIAREVARSLPNPISWQLLDIDARTLEYAVRSMGEVPVRDHLLDLTRPLDGNELKAPFAFAAFTLMEFAMTPTVAQNLAGLVAGGGTLVLYMPDVLVDIEQAETTTPGLLRRYRAGHCELTKLDKFTQRDYPFHANRLEYVIRDLGTAGMHLVGIDRLPRCRSLHSSADAIFCLRFVLPAEAGSGRRA